MFPFNKIFRQTLSRAAVLVLLLLIPWRAGAQNSLWGWGKNDSGELGDGTWTDRHTPVPLNGLSDVTAVSAGYLFSLALKADGTVWAWGDNEVGELGIGSQVDQNSPVQVVGLSHVIAISAGGDYGGGVDSFGLALKADGTVWAWGDNEVGELGDGTTTSSDIPVQVSGLSGVIAISAGDAHSLAIKVDGTLWAWGENYIGQLGDGTQNNRVTPVQVPGLHGVVAVAAGYDHSLALLADGTVWAWGNNFWGELGDGYTEPYRTIPGPVIHLSGVTAIAAGGNSSLALLANGTVKAWGENEVGQLGDGTTSAEASPVFTIGLSNVVAISTGHFHSLALKADGTVWACGDNEWGQLGDGGSEDYRITMGPVSGLSNVIAIDAGISFSLVLMSTGALTTVQVENRTGNIQRPVALRATLTQTDNAASVVGETLVFTLDGVSVGKATTDDNGIATLVITVPQASGTGDHVIKAQFRGDTSFGPGNGQGTLYVCPGLCNLAWTTPPRFQYGQIGETLLLSTSLTNDLDNAPLPGHTLFFTLDGTIIGWGKTDAHGIASLPLTLTESLGLGSKSLTVLFNGDRLYYSAPPQTVALKIYKAIPDLGIDSVSGQAGQSVMLSAHLWRTRDHSPLAGRTLFFRVEGVAVGSGITDASGTATLSYTIPVGMSSGVKSVTAAFLSDPFDYSALRTADALTVNP